MSANRPSSLVPLLLGLALVIAPAVGGAALMALMAVMAPDGDRYVPTLDALTTPDDWETVHTEVVDGGFMTKARATRYYFADLDPVDGVSAARVVARAAGFSIHPRELSSVECDHAPPDASACPRTIAADCRSYNGGLPTDCSVQAVRTLDWDHEYVEQLWISLDRRGSSFTDGTGDERTTISDPERALIRITVDAEQRKNFEPTLGSPTPAG